MKIQFVTGADSRLFLNACALISSFRFHAGNACIHVCDFGLTAKQSVFFESLGVLLPIPESLKTFDHPFYRKGGVYDYLTKRDYDVLAWLDADMILAAPIEDSVISIAKKLRDERKAAAACRDINRLTVGEFVEYWIKTREDLRFFKNRLAQNSELLNADYLNSAMVILRGNDIAKKWRDETLQSPISFLFEQNAFNRTVWMNGGALVLDENEWNLNAEMAGNDQAPNSVAGARVLHSSGTPETMRTCNITLQTGGEKFTAPLRTFWRKDLMNLHIQYIHHLFAANPDSVANLGSAGQSP